VAEHADGRLEIITWTDAARAPAAQPAAAVARAA
jgi:hypothetical protein